MCVCVCVFVCLNDVAPRLPRDFGSGASLLSDVAFAGGALLIFKYPV